MGSEGGWEVEKGEEGRERRRVEGKEGGKKVIKGKEERYNVKNERNKNK